MEHKEKHFSLSWFFKWFLDIFSNLVTGAEHFHSK